MAEWLRRLTRNQLGSSRVGSSPADVAKRFNSAPYYPLMGLRALTNIILQLLETTEDTRVPKYHWCACIGTCQVPDTVFRERQPNNDRMQHNISTRR